MCWDLISRDRRKIHDILKLINVDQIEHSETNRTIHSRLKPRTFVHVFAFKKWYKPNFKFAFHLDVLWQMTSSRLFLLFDRKDFFKILRTVEIVAHTLILLHIFPLYYQIWSVLLQTGKKYVIQTSLSVIQTGALCITDAALCTTDDSVRNTDGRVYILRLLEFVCIREKNSMWGNESV